MVKQYHQKEYLVYAKSVGSEYIGVKLNGDTGANYGYQYLYNIAGSISAARGVNSGLLGQANTLSLGVLLITTPTGFIKTCFNMFPRYSSGTTLDRFQIVGTSWNNTGNVTSLNFTPNILTFTSGTRIIVYARKAW